MELEEAMISCWVRGYITRDEKPNDKYWKNGTHNGVYFDDIPTILSQEDKAATDWGIYDPEGEQVSIAG